MIGENIVIVLQTEGMDVEWVRDGHIAYTFLQNRKYDGVLLDLSLPGMDGYEILRDMRDRGDRTPVFVITARASTQERDRCLRSGADVYLTKPFSLDELLIGLEMLLH